MPLTDTKGVTWAHSKTIKEGDKVRTDGGFTCIGEGVELTVQCDHQREGFAGLYIPCADGEHYLDGQIGDDGELVGLYPA